MEICTWDFLFNLSLRCTWWKEKAALKSTKTVIGISKKLERSKQTIECRNVFSRNGYWHSAASHLNKAANIHFALRTGCWLQCLSEAFCQQWPIYEPLQTRKVRIWKRLRVEIQRVWFFQEVRLKGQKSQSVGGTTSCYRRWNRVSPELPTPEKTRQAYSRGSVAFGCCCNWKFASLKALKLQQEIPMPSSIFRRGTERPYDAIGAAWVM